MTALKADPLALLRTRTSTKWATYPADVLPMFVAEMDYPIAPAIAAKLVDLVGRSDLGYDSRRPDLGAAFAGFAKDAWDWEFDPATLKWTVNVVTALTELVRAAIEPGDKVLINTPIYPPFFGIVEEAGATQVDVPLVEADGAWSLDLDGIEAAFRDGVRVYLLCNPHNPIGFPHPREHLERIAELAAQYDVLVLSDEIHGALTHSDAEFVPFSSVSEAAREVGVVVTSGTKAFNLAGVTAAWWIPGSKTAEARYKDRLPESVVHRTSHFGTHAATVGFNEGREWLASAVEALESQRRLLRELLEEHLPAAILHEATASYLAWIDFRPLKWGDNPQQWIVKNAKVALTPGHSFGELGKGFARLNFACSPEVLEEGVRRIAALA